MKRRPAHAEAAAGAGLVGGARAVAAQLRAAMAGARSPVAPRRARQGQRRYGVVRLDIQPGSTATETALLVNRGAAVDMSASFYRPATMMAVICMSVACTPSPDEMIANAHAAVDAQLTSVGRATFIRESVNIATASNPYVCGYYTDEFAPVSTRDRQLRYIYDVANASIEVEQSAPPTIIDRRMAVQMDQSLAHIMDIQWQLRCKNNVGGAADAMRQLEAEGPR